VVSVTPSRGSSKTRPKRPSNSSSSGSGSGRQGPQGEHRTHKKRPSSRRHQSTERSSTTTTTPAYIYPQTTPEPPTTPDPGSGMLTSGFRLSSSSGCLPVLLRTAGQGRSWSLLAPTLTLSISKAVPLHAMETLMGRGVYVLLAIDFGTRWGWVVSVTSRPCFTPRERTPGTHCIGGWVGSRDGLDHWFSSAATENLYAFILKCHIFLLRKFKTRWNA